jgi:ubiquinone/menaquinone biosynthesis C-methylase UbiE
MTPPAPPAVTPAAIGLEAQGDGVATTQRAAHGDGDGPPEIQRFLSPPPAAGDGAPPSTPGTLARRRSRRTVRSLPESTPPKAPEPVSGPVTTVPEPRVHAVAPPAGVAAVAPVGPVAGEPRTVSDRAAARAAATAPIIPPAPPVPTMPGFRAAPTLRTVPRPVVKLADGKPDAKDGAKADGKADGKEAKLDAADGTTSDSAITQVQAPRVEMASSPDPIEVFEVIRPMRIISIGTEPVGEGAAASAAPLAIPSAPAATPDVTSKPPPPPSGAAISRPPKPPVVEEVEAIEEEDEEVSATPRAARTDEIEPLPDDHVTDHVEPAEDHDGHERISYVEEVASPATDDDEDVSVELEDAAPRKPPPKRPISIEPPASAESAKPVAAPPPPRVAADGVAASAAESRKRVKPWWEEVFSDDFIRTMEKLDGKVVRKECDFIEDRLGLEKGAVMLDLACGSGAHAVELATRGYNVVGYDLSLAMLALAQDEAQDRGQKINFLQGDMREMAFEEAFDGIYSWSTSFGYFEDEKNLNVLSRVRRALRQGGMFLLDVANRDYVCPRQPSLVWFEGDECVCMDEMHVDFFTSRLRVKRTVLFEDGRSRECEYGIRLYGLHELGKMLHETGFKVVEVTGHPAHPGVFFGSESPRIIVLAERA